VPPIRLGLSHCLVVVLYLNHASLTAVVISGKEKGYETSVKRAYTELSNSGHEIDALRYGHLRAAVEGLTTIQGADDPGKQVTLLRTLWKRTVSTTQKMAPFMTADQFSALGISLGSTIASRSDQQGLAGMTMNSSRWVSI
jgi:hypothetical protein